jgi:MFS family permease
MVYYDKAILGSAALFGMTTDLELSVKDYSTSPPTVDTSRLGWATSIFYFGMLAGLYPMTFILQRFNIRTVLGPVVLVWAVICAATAGVSTWQGLYVQRFFLGLSSSALPPASHLTKYRLHRKCHPYGLHDHSQWVLHSRRTSSQTGLVVFRDRLVYNHWQCPELRVWSDYIWIFEKMAVYLYSCRCAYLLIWPVVLQYAELSSLGLVLDPRRTNGRRGKIAKGTNRCEVSEDKARSDQRMFDRCQDLPSGYHDGSGVSSPLLVDLLPNGACMYSNDDLCRYTINGAISGFGPLIVSTFGYDTLDSILFQFPVGGVCVIFIPLCGYISTIVPNVRIPMLIACCLPVIAGCVMIWKSEWGYRPVTPVVGYALTGFFGPVVSLIITTGACNVAGATKKTVMAATVFVAYTVGNIIGPQLVKSDTKAQHYPELWTGMIIW